MYRQVMLLLAMVAALPVDAQIVRVDARAFVAPPLSGHLKLGSATAPDGTTLGVNSRYMTIDGKPWLPVMGEVHFVRLPHAEWDRQLARIKASGIDVIATYFFWNYHEETKGSFDWSGDRDVRRFVQLAASHGLKVVARLGPWVHAEVRYGGLPDWIVRQYPTRGSDPGYMAHVDRYWGEIANQLKGLLWKEGGPIIGVQLENEYNLTGLEQGRRHIADLKALALRHGLDVPFYTVTGWDGAVYPRGEVLPVFGGYPDEPWGLTTTKLRPKETYAFRFDSRVSGNLGAQTQGARGDADPDMAYTPFLGAEYGGGVPTMYRRRPVIAPDDIAAMLPVQLGSGVNLYGYYMYHGGRNLIGRTTLEEKTAIGGYNDLPIIDYDFQAPFGEYGEAREVMTRIRPMHLLLQSYGTQLAPMTVRRPAMVPAALDDLRTLRWSVRSSGNSGFVFVSNHVRQHAMVEHRDVRFSLALPGGDVNFPSGGISVVPGAYFIWPIGLDLGELRLEWASAQPVTRVDTVDGPLHVFMANDGVAPEFAFAPGARVSGAPSRVIGERTLVTPRPGRGSLFTVTSSGATTVRILTLSQADARRLQRVDFAGATRLILSDDEATSTGRTLNLYSTGDSAFDFSAWPALPRDVRGDLALSAGGADGIFTRYAARATPRTIKASVSRTRIPGVAAEVPVGGVAGRAIQPWPESFGRTSGAWTIKVPEGALAGVEDAFMRIDWVGDIGRLFAGETLIDDRFFDGQTWRVGLRRHATAIDGPLTLRVTPLRAASPVYIDDALRPAIPIGGQAAAVRSVSIEPIYRLTLQR